jgi:hypothetical protein
MNLFGFRRRSSVEAPVEVIQAACNLYGIAPETVPSVKAERLKALSDNVWVVNLGNKTSAVVAYTPREKEHTMSAPWFGE